MTSAVDYPEISSRRRRRLRWRLACFAQATELPDPDDVIQWGLQIEVFQRFEQAMMVDDLQRLDKLLPLARRILGS